MASTQARAQILRVGDRVECDDGSRTECEPVEDVGRP